MSNSTSEPNGGGETFPLLDAELTLENLETLERLVNVLDYAEGFTLLFARCNVPVLRQQLIALVKAKLAARHIPVIEVEFDEPIKNLRQHLRQAVETQWQADASVSQVPDAESMLVLHEPQTVYQAIQLPVIFISGLEYSLPYDEPKAPLLAEVNLGRELLQRDLPYPLLFWLPDYAITALARYAPDFWAWRSIVFEFVSEASHFAYAMAQSIEREGNWLAVDNLNAVQKQRRLRQLESLLDEHMARPTDKPVMIERMRLLSNLGQIHDVMNNYRRAIDYYKEALNIARAINDERNKEVSLGNLGNVYRRLGNVKNAFIYYQQALEIARKISDLTNEGAYLANIGLTYFHLGQTHKAIEYLEQALDIARKIGNRHAESICLSDLGSVYFESGRLQKAIENYEQALQITREIGDKRGEASQLANLGSIYLNYGHIEQAMGYSRQALQITRELGDKRGEGINLGNLGRAYAELGQLELSIKHYQRALQIAQNLEDRYSESIYAWNLGLVREHQGRYIEAAQLMQLLVDYEQEINHPDAEKNAERLTDVQRKAAELAKQN